jgi:hypothetical protein
MIRDVEQASESLLGRLGDSHKKVAAMAHFHNRHPRSGEVDQFITRSL